MGAVAGAAAGTAGSPRLRGGSVNPEPTFVLVELLGVVQRGHGWGIPSGDFGDDRRSAITQGGRFSTGILYLV